jgi:hypothetical protein
MQKLQCVHYIATIDLGHLDVSPCTLYHFIKIARRDTYLTEDQLSSFIALLPRFCETFTRTTSRYRARHYKVLAVNLKAIGSEYRRINQTSLTFCRPVHPVVFIHNV